MTVFSRACYKPNYMWKRLQLVSGVALLATIAITFSAAPIALQNPPAAAAADATGAAAHRGHAVVDVQRRR